MYHEKISYTAIGVAYASSIYLISLTERNFGILYAGLILLQKYKRFIIISVYFEASI